VDHTNVELHLYINKNNTIFNPTISSRLLITLNQLKLLSININTNHIKYMIPLLKLSQLHSINQPGSMGVDNR